MRHLHVVTDDDRDPIEMSYEDLVNEANALIAIADSETGATTAQDFRCQALLTELEVRRSE
jgi:hypothetical protein